MENVLTLSIIDIPTLSFIDFLSLGVIGFGFLMAYFAYRLLRQEQRKAKADQSNLIIRSITYYMVFTFMLCGLGLVAQIYDSPEAENPKDVRKSSVKDEISELDNKRQETYTKLVNMFPDRSKMLYMKNEDYWKSRGIFTGTIELIGPVSVTKAANEFIKICDLARKVRSEGKTSGWQDDPNSPYYQWDVKRKALISAMKNALPSFNGN